MDLYCAVCGEPWEIDSLHEEAEEQGITFEEMRKVFRTKGCKSFMNGKHNANINTDIAEASAVIQDMMGDDVDATASFMEDFFG